MPCGPPSLLVSRIAAGALSVAVVLAASSPVGSSAAAFSSPPSAAAGVGVAAPRWRLPPRPPLAPRTTTALAAAADGEGDGEQTTPDENEEAARLRARAERLREQIRSMESELPDDRGRARPAPQAVAEATPQGMSLKGKRVLVVGANGRVGSIVCRYLLRTHPEVREVVAQVHVVGEASTRGWGRLSYEVGAEDGVGTIGPAWSGDDRMSTFEWSPEMEGYNLNKLRIVEAELLDPIQTATITEDVDCVIWCATDFNGNKPRAVAGLNVAFLFRAVTAPDKGRVEIEGLRNVLGGLYGGKQDRRWKGVDAASREVAEASGDASSSLDGPNDPLAFVLISASKDAFEDFETPFGTFRAQKREGEDILKKEFPSLSYTVLQMSQYNDNFVEEDLEAKTEEVTGGMKDFNLEAVSVDKEKYRRKINRRDAAREAVDALTDDKLKGKVVEVWTAER